MEVFSGSFSDDKTAYDNYVAIIRTCIFEVTWSLILSSYLGHKTLEQPSTRASQNRSSVL